MKILSWLILVIVLPQANFAEAKKDCETIGLLGEFKSPTGRLSQPFGVQIKLGAEAGREFLHSALSNRCYQFELLDIDNSAANIPDIIRNAKHIKFFVGLGISDQALVARKALLERNAILLTPTASSNLLNEPGNRIVTMFPRNQQIARFLAESAIRKGIREVAIISASNSTYSSGMAADFKSAFIQNGGKVIKEIQFGGGRIDTKRLVDELRPLKVAHIFLPIFELDVAQIISFLHRSQIDVSFIGTDAWGSNSTIILKLTQQIPFSALLPSIYNPGTSNKINTEFKKLYRKANDHQEPTDLAAFSFDSILLIDQMIKRCSKDDLQDLNRCLRNSLPLESVTGRIASFEGLNLKRDIALRSLGSEIK